MPYFDSTYFDGTYFDVAVVVVTPSSPSGFLWRKHKQTFNFTQRGRIKTTIAGIYELHVTITIIIGQLYTQRTRITVAIAEPFLIRKAVGTTIQQVYALRKTVTVAVAHPYMIHKTLKGKIRDDADDYLIYALALNTID